MYTRYMLCQSCYDKLDLPNPYRTGVVHAEWIFTATGRVCSQSAAWIEGVLQNWYINSVDDTPSVWTEEHISELCENFIVYQKIRLLPMFVRKGTGIVFIKNQTTNFLGNRIYVVLAERKAAKITLNFSPLRSKDGRW